MPPGAPSALGNRFFSELSMNEAERSVLRGVGPARQALPLDMKAIAALNPARFGNNVAKVAVARRMFIASAMFMLRELEQATLRVKHAHPDKV